MRRLILLAAMAASAGGANAATLNKCIDTQGRITYSNLPCRNARETRTVEIDPVPVPDPVRPVPVAAQPVEPAAPRPAARPEAPATLRVDAQRVSAQPVARAPARQCDALADKLGRILDKMDQARRKGYTQEQMNAWDREIKALERKKQQSSCF
jgi:hypothetical protein